MKYGLTEKLMFYCENCKNTLKSFNTSKATSLSKSNTKAFEVNVRSVLAAVPIGQAVLKRFCPDLDLLVPVTKKPFNNILNLPSKQSEKQAEVIMKEAADRLKYVTLEEEPENIECDKDGNIIAHVAVTVDGTWQKRGHSSKIGVVFVISVRTGEVLDYIVKDLVCHTCQNYKKKHKTEEYIQWSEKHSSVCYVNHKGSLDSMESQEACETFLRSVEKRNLKYTQFVRDGDTGTFAKVRDSWEKVFKGNYVVVKEECVGHVQKRMGSCLREPEHKRKGEKLSDVKVLGGKGRLTDKIIDKIQNYYGEAIRNNTGDIEGTEVSI